MINLKLSIEALLSELKRVTGLNLPTDIDYLIAERTNPNDLVVNSKPNIELIALDTDIKEWVIGNADGPNGFFTVIYSRDKSVVLPIMYNISPPNTKQVGYSHLFAYLVVNVKAEVQRRQGELARDGTPLIDKAYQEYKDKADRCGNIKQAAEYLRQVEKMYKNCAKPIDSSGVLGVLADGFALL